MYSCWDASGPTEPPPNVLARRTSITRPLIGCKCRENIITTLSTCPHQTVGKSVVAVDGEPSYPRVPRPSGRDAVRQFAAAFRAAFPDLAFGGTADLLAEGDYVVGQWIGGGTHTGAPMTDLPLGGLPEPNTGKTMRFTGTTGPEGSGWSDRRGSRPRRRRDRPQAARTDHAELTADHPR